MSPQWKTTPAASGFGGQSFINSEKWNPLHRAFIDAAVEAGYPATGDMNGFQQEGFGIMDRTTRDGRRWSAADAYLKPALGRANLVLVLGALLAGFIPGLFLEKALAFIAGDFIYIGASDLLPEAHRKFNWKVILSVVGGMAFMEVLRLLVPLV